MAKIFNSKKKSKGEFVRVLAMKVYRRSRITAPLILKLGTWLRWGINLIPWPLYSSEYPIFYTISLTVVNKQIVDVISG
jgi:hypothetical protein